MIVSGFTAALDLDTYPLRNLIRPRCAERAKPGRGKPVLIMHIGFLNTELNNKRRLDRGSLSSSVSSVGSQTRAREGFRS